MSERELPIHKGPTRKDFLKAVALVTLGTDQVLIRLAELPDLRSKVKIVGGQEIPQDITSGVLVLGGATVRKGGELARAITPGLKSLGLVMYADYSKASLDVADIANDLTKIQERTGMSKLSLYGHSLGAEVAGELVERIGDKFSFPNIIFNCTPTSLDDTRSAWISKPLSEIPGYHGGYFLTELVDVFTTKNLFDSDAAYPDLLWDQLEILKDGQRFIPPLAEIARRDKSNVIFLRPQDQKKDTIVDDSKAEGHLRLAFPNMRTYYLQGNQGHANELVNRKEYQKVLIRAINDNPPG